MKDYDFYGGFPPYTQGSDTSLEAAARQLPTAETRRQEVYKCIWRAGRGGSTDEETADYLNERLDEHRTPWNYNTVGPRRRELVNAGCIVDSGTRRMTVRRCRAVAWRIAYSGPPVDEGEGT